MTPREYAQHAMVYAKGASVEEIALGLVGEAGEIAECLKKAARPGKSLSRIALRGEIGDAWWYATAAAALHEEDLEILEHRSVFAATPLAVGLCRRAADCAERVLEGRLLGHHLGQFLGDLHTLAQIHNITMDDVLRANVAKLVKRYGRW